MTKISALVMVYNEEKQIRQCLDTIRWADEIVICDSFSTDKTVQICREYTGKIFQRKFDNFGDQKKWTLDKPTHEWVLFVEADERFSQEMGEEIRSRIGTEEGVDGYWIWFRNHCFGRLMKSDTWRFKKLKVYRKEKGSWQERKVHANFILQGESRELSRPLDHYPYPNIGIYCVKLNRSTRLEAEELVRRRYRLTLLDFCKAIVWIPVTFWRYYISWKGYRDGWQGFVLALLTSPYNLMVKVKYLTRKRHDAS